MANQYPLVGTIILIGSITDIFIFSSMRAEILILLIVGSILAFISLFTKYRIASLGGLVLLGAGIATSIEVETLLEVRMILTAVFGIFLPLFLIGMVTLSTSGEKEAIKLKGRRHQYLLIAFVVVSLLSIPMAAIILQILFPTVSLQLSTLIEIAIVMTVATVGIVILTSIGIRKATTQKEEEEPTAES